MAQSWLTLLQEPTFSHRHDMEQYAYLRMVPFDVDKAHGKNYMDEQNARYDDGDDADDDDPI